MTKAIFNLGDGVSVTVDDAERLPAIFSECGVQEEVVTAEPTHHEALGWVSVRDLRTDKGTLVDQADAQYCGFSADPDDPVTGVRRIGHQLPPERTAWENALPDSLFDL